MYVFRPVVVSALLHLIVVSVLWRRESPQHSPILVTLAQPGKVPQRGGLSEGQGSRRQRRLDLRPSFARAGLGFFASKSKVKGSGESGWSQSEVQADELLNVNPKIVHAFDQLAAQIDHFLDYPSILIENGVTGTASLDLYFDSEGEIDEVRSQFLGGHRSLRGLLVRASRQGLETWYRSSGGRLKRDEFKNQHFRADFSISYALTEASRVEKEAEGSYLLTRRSSASICAQPTGVDVTCLMMKGYGVAQRNFSDSYRSRLVALQDVLDNFDQIGLQGMRRIVRGT